MDSSPKPDFLAIARAVARDVGLAGRNLLRNRNRTLVALLTVATGIVAFLLAGGFIAWILNDGREATIHSQLGHAQIVRPGYYELGLADPYAFLLDNDAPERKLVESLPGVKTLTPRLLVGGLISHGETTLAFLGDGIDPEGERLISKRITLLAGHELSGSHQRQAMLGEGLARNLGVVPGDAVILLVTTAKGRPNAIELTVEGVFSTITKDYDDYAVRLPIGLARKLLDVAGETSWVVLLERTADTPSFIDRTRSMLPPEGFELVSWHDLADFFNKTESLFSKQVHVVKIIIGLIIVLTISNTLTMSVLERTMEIGTALAIGVKGTVVARLFIIEGVLLGLVGGTLGVVLGFVAVSAISLIGIPMPAAPGMAHGYLARIAFSGELAFDALVLGMTTTLLASALPAWKAARMNIVDALRYGQ